MPYMEGLSTIYPLMKQSVRDEKQTILIYGVKSHFRNGKVEEII